MATHFATKSNTSPKFCHTPTLKSTVNNSAAPLFTFPCRISRFGSAPGVPPKIVPVFKTNWLVEKSALSRKTSWYSWDVLRGRAASFWREKCRVLMPVVEGSEPLFETAGRRLIYDWRLKQNTPKRSGKIILTRHQFCTTESNLAIIGRGLEDGGIGDGYFEREGWGFGVELQITIIFAYKQIKSEIFYLREMLQQ